MDKQLEAWKRAVDGFWSADAPDYAEAARLVGAIADTSAEPTLKLAAQQAWPSLREAIPGSASKGARNAARRHVNMVRDVLYTLTKPRFGKRGREEAPLTPEQRYRQMLGLPLGRPLFGPEIHRAYKRAAKSAHPDVGGSVTEFVALAKARDALMKER